MKIGSGYEKYRTERDAYEAAYKAAYKTVLARAPHEPLKWVVQEAKKRARLQAYHAAPAQQIKKIRKSEPQWLTALCKVISASGVIAFIVSVPDFLHMLSGHNLQYTPVFGYWLFGVMVGGMVLGCVVLLVALTIAGSYKLRYACQRKTHRTASY